VQGLCCIFSTVSEHDVACLNIVPDAWTFHQKISYSLEESLNLPLLLKAKH
jgi:hypothetical protein